MFLSRGKYAVRRDKINLSLRKSGMQKLSPIILSKSFDCHENVNSRLFIAMNEQLKRWREHFSTVLNHITFGEVSLYVNKMASDGRMGIWAASPGKREITFVINALNRGKVVA